MRVANLTKTALRIVVDEKSLHDQELLSKFHSSDLYHIRCQDTMKTVFKAIQFETIPKYMRGLFSNEKYLTQLTGNKETF